jgi:hypothetical protein
MANYFRKALSNRWRDGFKSVLLVAVDLFGAYYLGFIMGNPSNFEGGNIEGESIKPFRSSLPWWSCCTKY